MRPIITRRALLGSATGAVSLSHRANAESWDHIVGRLRPLCLREFAVTRGGLALATVGDEELIFLSNRESAYQTLWKPGSTVKPFLLRHLIERGLLGEEETFPCSGGPLPFAGRRLDCSHAAQGAPLDPATALALSCNRCFLHWAKRIARDPGGRAGFAEALRRSGFSSRRPFGESGAAAVVNNPSSNDEMLLQALGEADVLTTPLALLDAYRRLLAPMRTNEASPALRVLRQGMRDCVRAGTGIEARVRGLDIGGKTGTSTSADRRSLNGWMVSYWPAAQPKFVMVVFVENGRGGVEAAPIAGEAWRALQLH